MSLWERSSWVYFFIFFNHRLYLFTAYFPMNYHKSSIKLFMPINIYQQKQNRKKNTSINKTDHLRFIKLMAFDSLDVFHLGLRVQLFAFKSFQVQRVRIRRFLPFHLVVLVDVTVLTQSIGVQLFVWALPGFLCPPVLVVTVVAHPLCVMLLVIVPAVHILLFSFFSK